ncbi:MAG TPA: DUF4012 domain-containing protein [Patescibacteria group bacterium]|nr:DUF4012 domain-containing protein [Patescibacteria group bacterium]
MHILLAYGEVNFMKKLKAALTKQGHQTAILPEGDPPKARYDLIFQLAHDPAQTAEGTRLLLNKVRKDQSRLFLVGWRTDDHLYDEAFHFARTFVEEAEKQGGIDTVTLNLGRLFGPGVPSSDSGALGHLVSEFSEGNILTLYGEGKDSDHYLYLDDAVEGLVLALEQAKSGETYALAPSIPITSEAAAHLLHDLGGGRHEIVFHRGLAAVEEKKEVIGKPLPEFRIKTPFHDGIVAILKTAPAVPRAMGWQLPHLRAPLLKIRKLKITLPRISRRVGIALAGIMVVLSPVIYLGGNASLGVIQLQRAKTLLGRGDFAAAATAVSVAAGSLERFGKIIPPARPLAEAVGAAAEIGDQAQTLTTALDNLVRSRRGEPVTPQGAAEFRDLAAAFSLAEEQLTFAWLDIRQDDSRLWRPLRTALEPVFEEGLRAVRFGEGLALGLPELLGYKGERNYLILFQNSAEIHPGGGRMGTFAYLQLQNGAIKELKFYNESDFLHIQSTLGARTTSGAFSLRPDFKDNAQAIADTFQQGEGKTVQGVVGVDLHFAQDLLDITGPFTLTDFDNQEITAENFFEVTTREVETDFFPGTDKKKRFIQALGEGVLNQLFSVGRDEYPKVAQLAWESLKGKELLLYFDNPDVYLAALESNFAGRIREAEGDFLYPYDHHAGTKGTVWVKRTIAYRIFNTTREGTMRAELIVTWKNEGTDAWPGGDYLNKTSVMVPQGSILIEAHRGKENVLSNFSTGTSNGKTLFNTPYKVSTYITVAPQSEQTLTLIYDLPKSINGQGDYTLLIQKQPGTVGDAFHFEFEEPFGYTATSTGLQRVDNKLIFEGSLTQDLKFEINLKER